MYRGEFVPGMDMHELDDLDSLSLRAFCDQIQNTSKNKSDPPNYRFASQYQCQFSRPGETIIAGRQCGQDVNLIRCLRRFFGLTLGLTCFRSSSGALVSWSR